jgi:spore coat protein U-like protein
MKRLIMALTIAAMGLAFSVPAGTVFGQTTSGTMNVDVTILPSCTVTTAPLSFGSVTGTSIVHVNTTVTVNCSNGAPYRIDMDGGQNMLSPTDLYRRMKTGTAPADTTNTLTYSLNKTTTWGTIGGDWGDNGATFCTTCTIPRTGKDGVGTGADDVHTVYGTLSTTVNGPGTYTDVVTVTVNY